MLTVRRVARTRVLAILSHLKVRVSCREEVHVATLDSRIDGIFVFQVASFRQNLDSEVDCTMHLYHSVLM